MKNKRTKGGARGERGGGCDEKTTSLADNSFTEEDDIDVGSPEQHQHDDVRVKMEDDLESPEHVVASAHHQQTDINQSIINNGGRISASELTNRLVANTSPAAADHLGRLPPSMYTSEMFNRLAYPFQSKLFNSCIANVKSNY